MTNTLNMQHHTQQVYNLSILYTFVASYRIDDIAKSHLAKSIVPISIQNIPICNKLSMYYMSL